MWPRHLRPRIAPARFPASTSRKRNARGSSRTSQLCPASSERGRVPPTIRPDVRAAQHQALGTFGFQVTCRRQARLCRRHATRTLQSVPRQPRETNAFADFARCRGSSKSCANMDLCAFRPPLFPRRLFLYAGQRLGRDQLRGSAPGGVPGDRTVRAAHAPRLSPTRAIARVTAGSADARLVLDSVRITTSGSFLNGRWGASLNLPALWPETAALGGRRIAEIAAHRAASPFSVLVVHPGIPRPQQAPTDNNRDAVDAASTNWWPPRPLGVTIAVRLIPNTLSKPGTRALRRRRARGWRRSGMPRYRACAPGRRCRGCHQKPSPNTSPPCTRQSRARR